LLKSLLRFLNSLNSDQLVAFPRQARPRLFKSRKSPGSLDGAPDAIEPALLARYSLYEDDYEEVESPGVPDLTSEDDKDCLRFGGISIHLSNRLLL